MIMSPRLLLALGVLAFASVVLGEDVTVPPRPMPPARPDMLDNRKATRAERDAAMVRWQEARKQWQEQVKAWEDALTPAQKAELKRVQEEEAKARQKEFERSRRLPTSDDGYSWREAASKQKLDAPSIDRLARDKIAYGATVKQIFTPYLGGPVFVTSDSLLNAFHVLFADAFCQYEQRQCVELRNNLEIVFRQARANLANSPFPVSDTAPAWRQAQFTLGPALCLLGSPIDLFDADVRPEIEKQVAKIRAAQDLDLPSWLAPATVRLPALDYHACKPIGFYATDEKLADYFRAVRWLQLVPFRGDRDVELAAIGMLGYGLNRAFQTGSDTYFRSYTHVLGRPDSRGLPEAAYDFQNFLAARPSDTWKATLAEKKRWVLPLAKADDLAIMEYRILPAYRLWDSAIFQKLADQQLDPEGLAVAMLLGSTVARSHLDHLTPEQVEAAAKESRVVDDPRSTPPLYEDYLDVLRTLTATPPADVPAFMRSEAWQAKSTQTVLSGWAQMRHAFALQGKRSEVFFGIVTAPPGFVEPNPEFFGRMADLIERSRALFDANRDRWDELASVTRKLEALAHKQIRQQPWSAEDEKFLRAYGARIAKVMGYEGNSYLAPNDDAPRWTDVHHNSPHDYSLAVAVGRPRIIYVLYPWNGMEILCQGAVMPYYEYRSQQRLTDAEWKQLLDSPSAPAQPAWLQTYVGEAGQRGPNFTESAAHRTH